MNQPIVYATELLKTSRHASMATVDADGSPHNTPYFFVYSPDITKLYWSSHPKTVHAQNIVRTGQLFVVLFHNNAHPHGLYFRAANPSKLYVADIQEMWVNGYEQDEKGMVTRDFREPVTAQDLLR